MMRALTLSELEAPLEAKMLGVDCEFSGVSTDSRTMQPGNIFVALRGEHFDGHAYLSQVESDGASAALVSTAVPDTFSQLLVDDTQRALGLLGA